MHRYLTIPAALTIGLLATLLGTVRPVSAEDVNPVIAIDTLLELDATMLRHAEAANARLLKVFPKRLRPG
jgi:hypothetical protein